VLLAVIISLALVLLTFALRTPLVPLESILGYLLSVFAALGAQVAVFQWGWAKQLLGVTPGVMLSFLPVIVLTIIFGLSNDYEVFVVSRIKEQYDRSRDARGSIRSGLAHSSRVVLITGRAHRGARLENGEGGELDERFASGAHRPVDSRGRRGAA
jgi:RND superfamily putative drug exporter